MDTTNARDREIHLLAAAVVSGPSCGMALTA